jgi:hypothetical protein
MYILIFSHKVFLLCDTLYYNQDLWFLKKNTHLFPHQIKMIKYIPNCNTVGRFRLYPLYKILTDRRLMSCKNGERLGSSWEKNVHGWINSACVKNWWVLDRDSWRRSLDGLCATRHYVIYVTGPESEAELVLFVVDIFSYTTLRRISIVIYRRTARGISD